MKCMEIPLELIAQAQQGDQRAIEEVLKRSEALIKKFTLYYGRTGGFQADLRQSGLIGVWRALQDFDSNKSSFFTHSFNWVRQKVGWEAKKHYKYFERNISSSNFTYYHHDHPPVKNRTSELMHHLESLDDRSQYILKRKFGIGCEEETQTGLGLELGISQVRVGQIVRVALKKLKHLMSDDNP